MFQNSEQNITYEDYYSFFLNTLLQEKRRLKCSSQDLADVFNCSKSSISHFENRIKKYDFPMLFNYAGYFEFKFEMFMTKMTLSEILSK